MFKKLFMVICFLLISVNLYAQTNQITSDLSIRAVINTVERGPIDAVWHPGGDEWTAHGDRVIWGFFHADPSQVSWGSSGNPDLYIKIWYDAGGRIDVNYFHVSVPDITVYSSFESGPYKTSTCSMNNRYQRHEYSRYNTQPSEPDISGLWNDTTKMLLSMKITILGVSETETDVITGFRSVYVTQSGSSVNLEYSDENYKYNRSGTISGSKISLSGEFGLTRNDLLNIFYNIGATNLNVSIGIHTGSGTLSGDQINYSGSEVCHASGRYMGYNFTAQITIVESSVLKRSSSLSAKSAGPSVCRTAGLLGDLAAGLLGGR